MNPASPFDRGRRRRVRAAATPGFLDDWLAEEARARLVAAETPRAAALLWCGRGGDRAAGLANFIVALDLAAPDGARTRVIADEEALPFGSASFDIIVSVGALHAVNDLPGVLIQARRALKPGGRFVAGLVGGLTLGEERALFVEAESTLTDRVHARFAPMLDTQAAAGLLQRAGFVEPVSDRDRLTARYPSLAALLAELRAAGESGLLAARAPLRRDVLARAAAAFAARADGDGKTPVAIEAVWLAGRAPGATAPAGTSDKA